MASYFYKRFLHRVVIWPLEQPSDVGRASFITCISVLHVKKLGLTEVKELAQGHTA